MYRKGSRAERELIKELLSRGFFVMRAAGSGFGYSPDILAFKSGRQMAIEVKARESDYLYIKNSQFENMKRWEEFTNITPFVAWRRKGKRWLLIPLSFFKKSKKGWHVDWATVRDISYSLDELG